MNEFTKLLEDYYTISIIYGTDHALKWLREVLKTDKGQDACFALVVESVKEAQMRVTINEDKETTH